MGANQIRFQVGADPSALPTERDQIVHREALSRTSRRVGKELASTSTGAARLDGTIRSVAPSCGQSSQHPDHVRDASTCGDDPRSRATTLRRGRSNRPRPRAATGVAPYAAALNAGVGRQFFDEGWRLGLVDLSRVCAVQPVVFIDGPEMIDANNPPSVAALANITLPLTIQHEFSVQPDQTRPLWSITSMNPNLRVFGNIAGPPTQGQAPWFGFTVAATPSMVQVVRSHGRYILRDGYHRAVSLLAHGIAIVPAFIWDDPVVEQVLPPGMLPQNVYRGPRPPVLLDYLDDEVADTVNLPTMRKVIVVQATEFLLGS